VCFSDIVCAPCDTRSCNSLHQCASCSDISLFVHVPPFERIPLEQHLKLASDLLATLATAGDDLQQEPGDQTSSTSLTTAEQLDAASK